MTDFAGVTPLFLFGLVSGMISALAFLPYIADTLAGRTRPQRASWLIWSALAAISFFSQAHEGASNSLWFAGAQASGTIVVFLLSVRHGAGNYFCGSDAVVLIGAICGLGLWYHTDNAVYALIISIAISFVGGLCTVAKSYREPDSETHIKWSAAFVASIFAILAVGKLDWVLLAYPMYLFVLDGMIVLALRLGSARQRAPEPGFAQFAATAK